MPIPHSRSSAREAEREVRIDGVEAGLLELVRLQLVEQADAAALLRHVEEHAARLGADQLQRGVELVAAVAAEASGTRRR